MPESSSSYANFRDPVGLVLRMLRSGDRAARSALLRAGSALVVTPFDALLASRERRLIREDRGGREPLLLIVGPPRSGSTLLYQLLAATLPVSYLTNWSALFPRATITASRIGPRPRATKRAPDLASYYGNTRGLRAPNDGFHVWNRWLGNDRYATPDSLDEQAAVSMRRFFAAWTSVFPRPFLNKNNRNASCVALLAGVLEDAIFIRTSRDPVFVAQSLLLAREAIQGDRGAGWGLGSERPARPADPFQDVAGQVDHVERTLDTQCAALPPGRLVRVPYEELCRDPTAIVRRVYSRVWDDETLAAASCPTLAPLKNTNERRLPAAEFDALARAVHEARSSS